MRKRLRIKPLTKRRLAAMKREHHKWMQRDRQTREMLDAVRRSMQITGDDLKIIIR